MKFGKHLQKRQLEIPEYAASFVNYKALKKLIKKLSATPTLHAQHDSTSNEPPTDPQASLQANKATFFFRLERELEKVNAFYLQKEAELKLRLQTLLDKKKVMQSHGYRTSKLSGNFMALQEGFQQFGNDLNKLQQYVEVNATAFSKILKKWDKTSKSRTKELYLSRAVEVQPCFNRDIISELSDQATASLLELGAWAEGEKISLEARAPDHGTVSHQVGTEAADADSQLLDAVNSGNISLLQDWLTKLKSLPQAQDQVTRIFLAATGDASDEVLDCMLKTGLVDFQAEDEINERNCLHEAAIFGRLALLEAALSAGVDVSRADVYGRIPLHYACMHGRIDMLDALVRAGPATIDVMDHDRFTPLIHAVVHGQLECLKQLLSYHVRINPTSESDHTPLNLACQHGFVDIARLLLENHAQVLADAEGLYPQHVVARSGKTPQLLLMLRDFGANLDEVDKFNQWTPLFHAASEGHVECLQTLLDNHVRVDVLDEKGYSAMYYAAWEGHLKCMRLLGGALGLAQPATTSHFSAAMPMSTAADTSQAEGDGIPDLSLPPPFIPLRRYGHNFLDSKTFIQITFEEEASDPILFYDGSKYPAARLTISSKFSDLIPRNLLLPIQEDTRVMSFQVDSLDGFAIDFEIFPTFGARVIAKTVALSNIFNGTQSSAGHCCLPLFDPRLRAIGQLSFSFQVIKPFQGRSLEITDFATYWKATTQFDSPPSAPITASSLSGEYVRLYVQLTSDLVPVLHSRGRLSYGGIEFPVGALTHKQFETIGCEKRQGANSQEEVSKISPGDIGHASELLASSFLSLRDGLGLLPSSVNVDLHVLYPSPVKQSTYDLGTATNLNEFADAILKDVFDHSRHLRHTSPDFMRSMIFSSHSADVCIALNWKQPNYPVFLCNRLGREDGLESTDIAAPYTAQGNAISIKEAVKIARNNNFMGLVCYAPLLNMVPTLVQSIRAAGLVLVTDTSEVAPSEAAPANASMHEGIEGVLGRNGVLRFGPVMM